MIEQKSDSESERSLKKGVPEYIEEPEEETRRRSSTNMVKDRQKASVINMQSAIEEEARSMENLSVLERPKVNHATWQTAEEAKQDPNRASSDLQSTTSEVQGK